MDAKTVAKNIARIEKMVERKTEELKEHAQELSMWNEMLKKK